MSHTHHTIQKYNFAEIKNIHPNLCRWLAKKFPQMLETSLRAEVSCCESGSCPVNTTLLYFELISSPQIVVVRISRALPQISKLDFTLAIAKQFSQ